MYLLTTGRDTVSDEAGTPCGSNVTGLMEKAAVEAWRGGQRTCQADLLDLKIWPSPAGVFWPKERAVSLD